MNLAADEGMLGASPEVIDDKFGEWLCALQRLLDNLPKSVDFLARVLNRNLDLQLGRVVDLGLGYNAYRSAHVWDPRPFAGPPRRVLGSTRTRALPRLRGGNNGGGGNGAGFAGVVEAGFAGVVEAGSDEVFNGGEVDSLAPDEVGSGAVVEASSGEVLGEVFEVDSEDLAEVLLNIGSDNGAEGCEGKVDDGMAGDDGAGDGAEDGAGAGDDAGAGAAGAVAEDGIGAVSSVLMAMATVLMS